MQGKLAALGKCAFLVAYFFAQLSVAQGQIIQPLRGTLVVAVPVQDGLVTCADKRLFNETTGSFEDDFLKIRKVDNDALFVATHTIGFLDKTTGKMTFNAYDV